MPHTELATDHHPLLQTAPPLDKTAIAFEDKLMQDRWGALFSIDDMVAGVAKAIDDLGLTESTYIFFTSDVSEQDAFIDQCNET